MFYNFLFLTLLHLRKTFGTQIDVCFDDLARTELTAFLGFLKELDDDDEVNGGPDEVLPFLDSISRLAAILRQEKIAVASSHHSLSNSHSRNSLGTCFHLTGTFFTSLTKRWEPH